ncbi:hypothetical protein LZ31DRAFT_260585 [Colletotrichum somersetense]|nr:hypothetical protein LZ31DRAFT_260585 [Colletotrichum somersetense]
MTFQCSAHSGSTLIFRIFSTICITSADGLVVKFSVAIQQRRGAGGSIPPRRKRSFGISSRIVFFLSGCNAINNTEQHINLPFYNSSPKNQLIALATYPDHAILLISLESSEREIGSPAESGCSTGYQTRAVGFPLLS